MHKVKSMWMGHGMASVLVMLAAGSAVADLVLPAVISSRMVLQRGQPAPIWGTAGAGSRVTVDFAGRQGESIAGADGRWLVRLAPLDASTNGRPMTIVAVDPQGQREERRLDDILVGEVWLGSGQSNMAMPVNQYGQDRALAASAARSYPAIRLIRSGEAAWQAAEPPANRNFSALLFAFGVVLQRELDVPVGLLVGAVGGTPSGAWLSRAAYEGSPACSADVARALAVFDAAAFERQNAQRLQAWSNLVEKAASEGGRRPGRPRLSLAPGMARSPIGSLYERHIRPFLPFAIRGVLWDQGEAGTGIGGVTQLALMGALIEGWRGDWHAAGGAGGAPDAVSFLFVQKPNGGGCAWDPADPVTAQAAALAPLPASPPPPAQAIHRGEHGRIAEIPGTSMVISSDLGAGTHPVNKTGYGTRAARVALERVYGRDTVSSGPVYASHQSEEGCIRIRFKHVGQGLAWRGERLQGFAVAGEDRQFRWADAVIDGDQVVVSAEGVPRPVAVRYAWAHAHPWANLFNRNGLPAVAFRTDDW